MIIWIKELFMQILIWLLGFIDCIFNVFRSIAGLDTVTTPVGEQTLGEYFLGMDGVQWSFWIVFIAAIGICAVCTVVAIVKNIIKAKHGDGKSHARTIGQSLSTAIISLFMATLIIVGMNCADGLLGAIDKGMNKGEQCIMSHEIINISVGDGYILDKQNLQGFNKYDEETGEPTYVSYLYHFEWDGDNPKTHPNEPNCIMFTYEDGTPIDFGIVYTPLLDDGKQVYDDNGNRVYNINLNVLCPLSSHNGWQPKPGYFLNAMQGDESAYYTKADLRKDFWDEDVEHLLGDDTWYVVPIPWEWDYDGLINPDGFNFFIAYICAIVLLIALIGATFGLVKRLFDIVLLFIALPGIAATIPLDDGAKFKLWRETVISKIFLAFGTVLAVNIFTIIAPSLWSVSIGTSSYSFANSVLRLVLICGGALTISGGQLLMARLLGTSAEESREMGQSARTLLGGVGATWGGAKAAGRGLFGYRNANGQRVGGLIKGGASAIGAFGGGAVNALGGAIGGQAYKSSKLGRSVSATQSALRGFGRSSGWFGGGDENNRNLGYTIHKGLSTVGGTVGGSGAMQKSGLNNGIIGGIKAPFDRRHAAARANARGMIAQGGTALDNAYNAAAASEAAKLKALPLDFGGREVLPGFEHDVPTILPAPIDSAASRAANKAGKKE